MGSLHLKLTFFLSIFLAVHSTAQEVNQVGFEQAEKAQDTALRDQIRIAADRTCTLEVQGSRPTVLVRQASAFLIGPDRAVTSARALAGGYGARIRIGQSTRGTKLVGLDLIHDVAILKLNSPFEIPEGLTLHGTELLGNERFALIGATDAMEQIPELGSLVGMTQPAPFSSFGLAKNLQHPGLEGAPILNGQGHVIGMVTSYQHAGSETRFVVSSAAILAVASMNPEDLAPGMVPESGGSQLATAEGIHLLLNKQPYDAVDKLDGDSTQERTYWLALALIASDRNVEAIEALDAHIQGFPNDGTAFLLRGQAHKQLMEGIKASSDFRMARSASKNEVYASMALARSYMDAGRGQEALRFLKSLLVQKSNYVPAMQLRGEIFAGRLRVLEARKSFESILAIDADHPGAWAGLGHLHLFQQSSSLALMCFDRALERDPGNLVSKIGRAEVFVQRKEWDKALQCLNPLMEAHPAHVGIILLTAHTYGRSRELGKAKDLYEQATFLYPDSVDAYLGLGTTYKAMAEHERAIVAFDNVLRIDPENVGALFSAGFCHLLLGDRGEARARYKTLRFIDPATAQQLFKMIYDR